MATISDDFTGSTPPNEEDLENRTNWNVAYNTMSHYNTTDDVRAKMNGNVDSCAYNDEAAIGDNQYSQGVISSLGSTSGDYIGVSVRGSSGNGYIYYGNDEESILVVTSSGGGRAVIATGGDAQSASDVVRLEISGTTLTPSLDGVTDTGIGEQTDATLSSGQPGLGGRDNDTSTRIDDFEGGDLAGGSTVLVVQDATHAHTAESPALLQAHLLAVADASHGHTAETEALLQAYLLAVQDSTHAHNAENVDLVQAYLLVVADALHAHTAENPALIQAFLLAVADALHAHSVDNIGLILSAVTLTVQDALHSHSAEDVGLIQAFLLAVQETLHGHAADNVALLQAHLLAVADATHGHSSDNADLVQAFLLAIAEALHGHTADTVDLTVSQDITYDLIGAVTGPNATGTVLGQNVTVTVEGMKMTGSVSGPNGSDLIVLANIAGEWVETINDEAIYLLGSTVHSGDSVVGRKVTGTVVLDRSG